MAVKKSTKSPSSGRQRQKTSVGNKSTRSKINQAMHGDIDDPMSRGEMVAMVCGVVLLALAAFTLLSFISHIFTGGEDQKLLQGASSAVAHNWAGWAGAWWSDFWINKQFGIGSVLINADNGSNGHNRLCGRTDTAKSNLVNQYVRLRRA